MIIRTNKNGTHVLLKNDSPWISLIQTGIPNLKFQDKEILIENDLLSIVYRRLVLQFAGIHCAVGGKIIVKCENNITMPFIDAVRQDISLVFANCFELSSVVRSEQTIISTYTKINILPVELYVNDGLTLGIISSGKNTESLSKCIESFLPHENVIREIIVSGPKSISSVLRKYPKTRLVPFKESTTDIRPYICHKKNKIAKASKCENILIIHERIRPTEYFSEIYKNISPHFEVIGNVMNDVDGNPIHSWSFLPFHDSTGAARLGIRMSDARHISPLHYGNGAVIFCKKNVYLQNPLDERLHWGEMEDNHWYQSIWHNGYSITTVQDFLCSDFSNSLTTNRYKKWMPSRYALQHGWLPHGYHSVLQFVLFSFLTVFRYLSKDILSSVFRNYKDPFEHK